MTDPRSAGLRSGLQSGLGSVPPAALGTDPMAGVAKDAASGKYFPASAAQWNTVFALESISYPFSGNIWLGQEASGNLADSGNAGGGALALVPTGSPNYQQAVTGFTRTKTANPTDGGSIRLTATMPEDINATSILLFGVFDMPTANPGGTRSFLEMGTNATRVAIEMLNTGVVRGFSAGVGANGTDGKSAVLPLTVGTNITGGITRCTTDDDKMLPTRGSPAGTLVDVWSVAGGSSSPICGMLYAARMVGFEPTDAQLKAVLQRLGWTITWS